MAENGLSNVNETEINTIIVKESEMRRFFICYTT